MPDYETRGKMNFKLFVVCLLAFGIFLAPSAHGFIGPGSQPAGTGGGAFTLDAAGNIGFGVSNATPLSTIPGEGFGYIFMVASSTNPGFALKNLSGSGNTYIWTSRNSGNLQLYRESVAQSIVDIAPGGNVGIGIAAPLDARLQVSGNVKGDTFVGSVSGAITAGNVSSDVFGSLQGGGSFAFPNKLAVATSSKTGLVDLYPSFFVYGGGYFSGNVGIGTIAPAIKLAIGDTDTGFHWISDGNLAVYTNNVDRMRVTSDGLVRIGTGTFEGAQFESIKENQTQNWQAAGAFRNVQTNTGFTGSTWVLGGWGNAILQTTSGTQNWEIVGLYGQVINKISGTANYGANGALIGSLNNVSSLAQTGTVPNVMGVKTWYGVEPGSYNDRWTNLYGTWTGFNPWASGLLNVTNYYAYYSSGSKNANTTVTNWYHFYGQGNYPSYFGGSVGIGVTNPTTARLVVATSTTGATIDVSGGKIINLGTPEAPSDATTKSYVDSIVGGSGGVGAGTSGQTLRHDGTAWVASSLIYNNGTNVGIGTTSPGNKLDVSGGLTVTGAISTGKGLGLSDEGTYKRIQSWESEPLAINPLGNNVGIGTTSPGSRLAVSPVSGVSADMMSGRIINLGSPAAASDAATKSYVDSVVSPITTSYVVQPSGGGQINYFPRWGSSSQLTATSSIYESGGNIGIGTTSPGQKLDVNGRIRIVSSQSELYQLSNRLTVRSENIDNVANFASYGLYLPRTGQTYNLYTSGSIKAGHNEEASLDISNEVHITSSGSSYLNGGSVGIATTTPGYKLDVWGTGRFTQPVIVGSPTDASHAATKNYVDSAYAPGGSSGNVGGTGTANYIPIWSSTSTIANSIIYQSGSNVGIGTTAPQTTLHLYNSAANSTPLVLSDATGYTANNGPALLFRHGITGEDLANVRGVFDQSTQGNYGDLVFGTRTSDALGVQEKMRILYNGNVGIATTTPTSRLTVSPASAVSADMLSGKIINLGSPAAASDAATKSYVDSAVGGGVGPGTSGQTLRHNGTNWVANSVIYNNGTNVGIGTTSPGAKLDIKASAGGDALLRFSHSASPTAAGIIMGLNSDETKFEIKREYSDVIYDVMAIDRSTGNVGIGTPNPSQKLDVTGTVYARRASTFNETVEQIRLGRYDLDVRYNSIYTGGHSASAENNFTQFRVHDGVDSTSQATVMTLLGNGNVGIATTTPTSRLTVSPASAVSADMLSGKIVNLGSPAAASDAATKSYVDSAVGGGVGPGTSGQTLRHNGTNWIANSVIYNNGTNVGIGTTSPGAKLDILESTILGSTAGNSQILQRTIGRASNYFMNNLWLVRDAAGSDWVTARLHDAISIDSSYLTPGTNTRTWWERDPYNNIQSWGDQANTYVTINNGNVGIGTTNPDQKLQVAGNIRLPTTGGKIAFGTPGTSPTDYLMLQDVASSSSALEFTQDGGIKFVIQGQTGNVGIGTSTPVYALQVNGVGSFNQPVFVGTPTNAGHAATRSYVDSILQGSGGSFASITVTGTSTLSGNWQLGGAALGDVDLNGYDITGVNKITAAVIDPLYEIDGEKYATYAPSVAGGVWEEYVGRGRLTRSIKNKVVSSKYEEENTEYEIPNTEYLYIIDFSKVPRGSDLWVWYNAVDFSKDNVEAVVTPYGSLAKIGYRIEGEKIIFFGDQSSEFSFRLFGKRHDWKEWGTKRDTAEKASFILKAK